MREKDVFKDKVVLITGGTGSFGQKFTEIVLKKHKPHKLIIFSRDEMKQYEMNRIFSTKKYPNIRYFIGDVRDSDRLHRAFHGVDIVVHAAALKIVPTAEYNPFEVVKTNVIGAENVINTAIDNDINKVIALSTDKAVNPINLYGATKLCAEKLFVAGNSYSGKAKTRFSVVRYGNVMGSRGSVVPIFLEKRETRALPITDKRMTRFWITLDNSVEFVIKCLSLMKGGEIFVPRIPSVGIVDLAKVIAPGCKYLFTGIRPGEKLHETLVTKSESRRTLEFKDMFIIEPDFPWWNEASHCKGKKLKEGISYTSDDNEEWLTPQEIRSLLATVSVEK